MTGRSAQLRAMVADILERDPLTRVIYVPPSREWEVTLYDMSKSVTATYPETRVISSYDYGEPKADPAIPPPRPGRACTTCGTTWARGVDRCKGCGAYKDGKKRPRRQGR